GAEDHCAQEQRQQNHDHQDLDERHAPGARAAGEARGDGETLDRDRRGHCGFAASGTRMSSCVLSFLSGPALETMVSSSSHWILKGLSQASVILDALSIVLSWRSICAVGH